MGEMVRWTIRSEPNNETKWSWPKRMILGEKNKRVYINYLRDTFMKEIDYIIHPTGEVITQGKGSISYTLFEYSKLKPQNILQETEFQYPTDIKSILGSI